MSSRFEKLFNRIVICYYNIVVKCFLKLTYILLLMPRIPKYKLKPLGNELTIGQRIAQFRKQKGMTQVELARKIGIEQYLVADYELGRIRLYDEMVAQFAWALGVSADEILGITNRTTKSLPPLRIMKRVKKIEKLPPAKQKAILQTLDMVLDSHDTENNQEG